MLHNRSSNNDLSTLTDAVSSGLRYAGTCAFLSLSLLVAIGLGLSSASFAQAPPTSPSFPGQQMQPKATASFQSIGAGLTGLELGAVDFGDFDNDGDQDLATVGLNSNNRPTTIVYENDGSGSFTALGAGLEGVKNSDAAWVDFDDDGDDDLVITGSKLGDIPTTILYESKVVNGNRTFEEVGNAGLAPVTNGSVSAGDFDDDGQGDILLTGNDAGTTRITRYYTSNGDGTFSAADLAGISQSSSDVLENSGGDTFSVFTGEKSDGSRVATVNELQVGTTALGTGVAYGSSTWGHFVGSSGADVFVTGEDAQGNHTATLYKNEGRVNGKVTFSVATDTLVGLKHSSSAAGDLDNDGDTDLVVTGEDEHGNRVSIVYLNDDNTDSFTAVSAGLSPVRFGDATFGEIGDSGSGLELVLLGDSPTGAPIANIYDGASSQCPKEWELNLEVDILIDNTPPKTLSLGQANTATAGLDNICGEGELPPTGPIQAFDTRFVTINGTNVDLGEGSLADFRPSDQVTGKSQVAEAVWKFEVKGDRAGNTLEIDPDFNGGWPVIQNSYDVTLEYTNSGGNQTVDFSTSPDPGATTITDENVTTFTISVTEKPEQTFDSPDPVVSDGWNIISFPYELNTMKAGNLGPFGAGIVAIFDPNSSGTCDSAWKYVPGSGFTQLSGSDPLENGRGYLVNCPAGTFDYSDASLVNPKEVSVSAGWNVVAPFEQDIAPSNVEVLGGATKTSDFFSFGQTTGFTNVSGDLEATEGYWVKIDGSGTLEMDPNTPKSAPAATPQRTTLADAAQLTLSDEAGHRATLHLAPGLSADMLSRFELPPQLPGTFFDVRFDNGTHVAPIAKDGVTQTLDIQGTQGPITLRASGLPSGQTVHLAAAGGSFEARLGADAPTVQVPAGVKALDVTVRSTPMETRLAKTYPNPASSQATIEFALDASSDVTVAVYDVLGRQVATLVEGRKQAGVHRAALDASTLQSGVYFVRMRTGATTQTQRLTVVK